MHLNISADTNNKCTNKDSNIASRRKREREAKKHMPARNINSPSVIHRPVCFYLFILFTTRQMSGGQTTILLMRKE